MIFQEVQALQVSLLEQVSWVTAIAFPSLALPLQLHLLLPPPFLTPLF
jgi:hypothetical protein